MASERQQAAKRSNKTIATLSQSKIPKLRNFCTELRSFPVPNLRGISADDNEPCTPQADSSGLLDDLINSTFKNSVDAAGGADGNWLIGADGGNKDYFIDELEYFVDAEDENVDSTVSHVDDECRFSLHEHTIGESLQNFPSSVGHHHDRERIPTTLVDPAHRSFNPLRTAVHAVGRYLVGFLGLRATRPMPHHPSTFLIPGIESDAGSPASQQSSTGSRSSRCLTEAFENAAAIHTLQRAALDTTIHARPLPLHQSPSSLPFCWQRAVPSTESCSVNEAEFQSAWSESDWEEEREERCVELGGAAARASIIVDDGRGPEMSPSKVSCSSSGAVSLSLDYCLENSLGECDVTQWLMEASVAEDLEALEGSPSKEKPSSHREEHP